MKEIKAWLVNERGEFRASVVFAESRGKARALAMTTDACEDVSFCDIEARRMPAADSYYTNGKTEMDWNNPADRRVLVRDCGFYCDYETFYSGYCTTCSAKEFCDQYIEKKKEITP